MTGSSRTLGFGSHALAVLAAAMLGSTIIALGWTATLAVAADDRLPGVAWLATLAMVCWLGVFAIALPCAAIILSLLWPATRRGSPVARGACFVALMLTGALLAPLGSPNMQDASILQRLSFALMGLLVAGCYLSILGRLAGRMHSAAPRPLAVRSSAVETGAR